jgi:YVTN family beta-propeller protein
VAFTPDGTRAYITNGNSGNVSVFDTATNTPVVGSPFATGGSGPVGVAITPCPQRRTAPAAPAIAAEARFTG